MVIQGIFVMVKIILEKIDETYSKIYTENDTNDDVLYEIQELFSIKVEGAQFSPTYKLRIWDGRKIFFYANKGVILNGLIPILEKYCIKKGYVIKKEMFPDYPDIDPELYEKTNTEILKGTDFVPREYQSKACFEILNKKHGILECCTSSGKSLIIYLFIRQLLLRGIDNILLIVPNIMLVKQMYCDFEEYGWSDIDDHAEKLCGGEIPTYRKKVLISTWQSLQKKDSDFFEKYKGVIVDECHSVKASVVNKLLKQCVNSIYRLGTTGTLPTPKSDLIDILSVLNRVVFQITSKELIDSGVLTRMIVANILVKYPDEFISKNKNRSYPEEVKLVEEYGDRNKTLDVIINNTSKEHNLLILVNHINHLKIVKKYIEKKHVDRIVKAVSGNVKASVREDIRQETEKEEGVVIVATYATMSTGVNIKKLHGIVLFGNSKSKIRVLQSLGRGLRKHITKEKVLTYDVVDDLRRFTKTGKSIDNYLYKHWQERLDHYEQQGFPTTTLNLTI